jgi:hypothetical protein
MKRLRLVIAALCLVLACVACGTVAPGDPAADGAAPSGSDGSGKGVLPWDNPQGAGDAQAGRKVDIDLTTMNSTMVYSEVYDIMTRPDAYIGKTIKMSGPYYSSYYDKTDMYYHYVIVEDAAACCMQGLEFIWEGDHAFPDDYPADATRVEVVGEFGSYDELGETYYYLSVDDITRLEDE